MDVPLKVLLATLPVVVVVVVAVSVLVPLLAVTRK